MPISRGQPHKHRPPSGLGPQHRQASMRVLRSEIWSMIPHIYHSGPSTARVDDGSAPITTSLGRRPKRAAPHRLSQRPGVNPFPAFLLAIGPSLAVGASNEVLIHRPLRRRAATNLSLFMASSASLLLV